MLDLSHMIQDMTNTNKNPDTTEMENLLNEDYKETMQGRTEERKNRFTGQSILLTRSEERRVGKECRYRRSQKREKKNENKNKES